MIIITCEHGGNQIPEYYRPLFVEYREMLNGHRGYDLGALQTARLMAGRFNAPLHFSTTSRLLVDLNRSVGHPRLFSKVTRRLAPGEKKSILARHYFPHRDPIQAAVNEAIQAGRPVLHVACHSFTPVLGGKLRSMDVGLLYDPHREPERRLCREWKKAILQRDPHLQVRANAPYKGVSDGLATYFRKLFPENYLGIELELNQHSYLEGKPRWKGLCRVVIDALEEVADKGERSL